MQNKIDDVNNKKDFCNSGFDYTEWRKDLFEDMTIDELSEKAMEYVNNINKSK
jgi:hypothetical protein